MSGYLKQFIFLGLFIFIHSLSNALPTFIEGKVVKGNGMVIRVSTYSDRISFQEKLLDMQEIDASENFKLSFEIQSIQEVFLQIGNQSFSFFAEAGKSYELQMDQLEIPPKSSLSEHQALSVIWKEKNELNEAIDNFNFSYSRFVEENFIALYKLRNATLLNSFEKEMFEKLHNTNTLSPTEKAFFENEITYRIADLKNASHTLSDQKLGETYLQNKEVLYRNPNYMLFFRNYFSQYFFAGKRNMKFSDFFELIRKGSKARILLDYMGKDPILIQERLRELVLLNALKEVYYNKDFDMLQIKKLILEIGSNSKFPEHHKIAAAILDQLGSLQIGSPAPEFKLMSSDGRLKSLSDYKGRYVYLFFMSDNCEACESDMASIEKLNEKYKTNIAFVGIMVNYTREGLEEFKKKPKTDWDMLMFANDFSLLNKYRVRNFPLYLLIDRKGNLLLSPAKKPYEGIDRYFDFLLKRDAEKGKKADILFR